MTEQANLNSASRLYDILINVSKFPANMQVASAWASIFGVEEAAANLTARRVMQRLDWMHHELDMVRAGMRAVKFRESSYASALQSIDESLSGLLLNGTVNQVTQYLGRETIAVLTMCIDILPDEEAEVSADDLLMLKDALFELEAMLDDARIPERLVKLIVDHIALIRGALDEYRIAGAKALRKAVRVGTGEIIEVSEIVRTNRDSPEVGLLLSVWAKVDKAAKIASTAKSIAQLGNDGVDLLMKYLA